MVDMVHWLDYNKLNKGTKSYEEIIMSKVLLSRRAQRSYCFENGAMLVVSRIDRRGIDMDIKWSYSFFSENGYQAAEQWERPGNEGWAWVDAQECADRYASNCG